MRLITKIHVNALTALGLLGLVTWRLLDIIQANDLDTSELQIIGAALMATIGGIVYVAKTFSATQDDPDDSANED